MGVRMADNKENIGPRRRSGSRTWTSSGDATRFPAGPRQLHASNILHYHGIATPSRTPTGVQQHSYAPSCRRADSPLKIRKTRENLRHAVLCSDVLPTCEQVLQHASKSLGSASGSNIAGVEMHKRSRDSWSGPPMIDSGLSTPQQYSVQSIRPLSPTIVASTESRVRRQKSISQRVLTRVKEGLSARTKATADSNRATDPEVTLLRRLSAKAKQTLTGDASIRSYEDIAGLAESSDDADFARSDAPTEGQAPSNSDIPSYYYMTRSSSIMTSSSRTRSSSDRLASPSTPSSFSSSPLSDSEPTPKPTNRQQKRDSHGTDATLSVGIPHMSLNISASLDSIDTTSAGHVWVSIEASVTTSPVALRTSRYEGYNIQPPQKSLDAVVLLSSDWAYGAGIIAKECLFQLFSHLDIPEDRLAVIYYHSHLPVDDHMNLPCTVAHPFGSPDFAYCCEQLEPYLHDVAIHAPQTCGPALHHALNDLASRGLQHDSLETFVVARDPSALADALLETKGWPAHQIRIGLHNSRFVPAHPARYSNDWRIHLRTLQDVRPYVFDELFGGLRRRDCWDSISSLHLCCRPLSDCTVIETIGQKVLKNLRPGQSSQLFVNLYVPQLNIELRQPIEDSEMGAIYAEVESMLGVLTTDVLRVEAEYRHPILPSENIIRLQHTFSVKRPQSGSVWLSGAAQPNENVRVPGALAHFIATHYTPSHGLKMINRWLPPSAPFARDVQQAREYLESLIARQRYAVETQFPHVTIHETGEINQDYNGIYDRQRTPSLTHMENTVPPYCELSETSPTDPSSRRPLPALPAEAHPDKQEGPAREARDSAREVWDQRIRRKSLSSQQMMRLTSDVQQMEASDDHLRVLHNKALTNKRSIGVETLRAWQMERAADRNAADDQRSPPWL